MPLILNRLWPVNSPGLVTITSSGEPGGVKGESATSIFIRGQNTWNGGQPLILVDGGVERDMSNVDVNEVQSISILKDASATAVFGVKGANGVILITTKRGEEGKQTSHFHIILQLKCCQKCLKR